MAEIKIILSTGSSKGDLFGYRFLRWAQRSPWSHCEVLYDNYIIGARVKGVRKYGRSSVGYKSIVLSLECTDDQKLRFDNFIHSKIGSEYDWRAYLGLLFNKKNNNHNKYFCSELLAEALDHAEMEVFKNLRPWFCMPRDFYINPMCKIIDIKVSDDDKVNEVGS